MRAVRFPPWVAPLALGLALLSVGLNLYLISRLRHPERWVAPLLADYLGRLSASDASFRYDIRLPAGTPLNLDIPINERFVVRVDTLIPIRTRVRLPFRTPVGTRTFTVPVRANVPLRAALPLRIRHTFRLRTRTGEEIVIPLELRARDFPLDSLLRSTLPVPP